MTNLLDITIVKKNKEIANSEGCREVGATVGSIPKIFSIMEKYIHPLKDLLDGEHSMGSLLKRVNDTREANIQRDDLKKDEIKALVAYCDGYFTGCCQSLGLETSFFDWKPSHLTRQEIAR